MSSDSEQVEYLNIDVTDFAVHANDVRPKSWTQAIRKTFRAKKGGRLYAKIAKVNDDGTIILKLPKEAITESGKKVVIRAYMPKGGVPIFAAPGVQERIDAINRKRDTVRVWRSEEK